MSETALNKNQMGSGIWTQDNLLEGTNISIREIPQPVIDNNTKILLHFDGNITNLGNDTNAIMGSSGLGFYTTTKKFGSASLYDTTNTTGTDDSQLVFTSSSAFGQDDFTVDFWLYKINASQKAYIGYRNAYYGPYIGLIVSNTDITFKNAGLSDNYTLSSTIAENWVHLAYEKYNGITYVYLNGEKIITYSTNYNLTYTQFGFRGRDRAENKNSFIDELRVSDVARYKGQNFTPFTLPYELAGNAPQYTVNNTLDISGKQDVLTTASGYDANATQVLKNVNGVLTWVTEA